MVNVHFEGTHRHRLESSSGMWIGWIHGRSIGLRGMRDEREATETAVALWEPLTSALAQHFPGRPIHRVSRSRLRVVHDGAYEWITDDRVPIARLDRRTGTRGSEQLAIEFVLPSYATEGVVISVAHVVALALLARRAEHERALRLVTAEGVTDRARVARREREAAEGEPLDAA